MVRISKTAREMLGIGLLWVALAWFVWQLVHWVDPRYLRDRPTAAEPENPRKLVP
jgi:hypothetical protein